MQKTNWHPNDLHASEKKSLYSWLADPKVQLWIVCGLLVLAVAVIFGQTATHEFILCDDPPYITGNPHVAPGLTSEGVTWAMTEFFAGNWHPLTWMSHMADVEMFGPKMERGVPGKGWPGGHHLVSMLLHAASSVILFLALRQMTRSLWLSAIVAAMFAVHPLRAESVAWAAERKDTLSGLFWMLTLLTYGWYARRPGPLRYLTVVVAFGLGLTAKSMLVTLPCVLLLLDYWPLNRLTATARGVPAMLKTLAERMGVPYLAAPGWAVIEKLPLFAMTAGVCKIIVNGQQEFGAMSMATPVSLDMRLANAALSYVLYIWKTIWPVNLAFFYPHPAMVGTGTPEQMHTLLLQGIAAGSLLLLITAVCVWNFRRRPYLIVGWLWFLGAAVPVIGIVQVGVQGFADRYTYLPTIGLYLMVVWGLADLAASRVNLRVPLATAAALVLLTWTGLGIYQASTWKNNFSLFSHAVDVTTDNYFALNHLGLEYMERANAAFERAILAERSGKPDEAKKEIAERDRNLGLAEEVLKEAVLCGPSYDSCNGNLGVCFSRRGDIKNAAKYFKIAVDVNPHVPGHHANLASAYVALGKLDAAVNQFREQLKLPGEQGNLPIRARVRAILMEQGKTKEAEKEYNEIMGRCPNDIVRRNVLLLIANGQPNDVQALNDYARLLSSSTDPQVRNGLEAVRASLRAVELTGGQSPEILSTLAAAYAQDGRFTQAADTAQRALDLAVAQNKTALVAVLQEKIARYRARVSQPSRP